ncbi:hypothetical protein FRC11_002909, partial [Ceratobasidium sp. 423]
MDKELARFHDNKSLFNQFLKMKQKFHNIPKFHLLQHYTHCVCMLGTPDGYNTEAPERLHIDLTKAGFQVSNKINDTELEQMAKYLLLQRMYKKHMSVAPVIFYNILSMTVAAQSQLGVD